MIDAKINNELLKKDIFQDNPFIELFQNNITIFSINFLYKIYKTIPNKIFLKNDADHDVKLKKCELCNYDKRFGLPYSHIMTNLTNINWILNYIDKRWTLDHLNDCYQIELDIKKIYKDNEISHMADIMTTDNKHNKLITIKVLNLN